MARLRLATLVIVFCAMVSGSLLAPATTSAQPPIAFTDCRDITLAVYYVDETGGHQIFASPSEKRVVPIDTTLRFFLYIPTHKLGSQVTFFGQNPFIKVNPATVLEGGVVTSQPDFTRFKIVWPGTASSDGQIVFEARHLQAGKLSTVFAQVAGGRCVTKIELVGRRLNID